MSKFLKVKELCGGKKIPVFSSEVVGVWNKKSHPTLSNGVTPMPPQFTTMAEVHHDIQGMSNFTLRITASFVQSGTGHVIEDITMTSTVHVATLNYGQLCSYN